MTDEGLAPNDTAGTGGYVAPDKPLSLEILSFIYLVTIPAICVTGVLGNCLAFLVFVSKPLRRTSCSLYLAARSITDGGFLCTTFVTWLSDMSRANFIHRNGFCQACPFLVFVFAFMSVWLTVVVTSENYIRICRPFSVSTFCNIRIARRCILALVIVSLAMYNYPLWTTRSQLYFRGNNTAGFHWCNPYPEYISLLRVLSFWDMLVTLIIPLLVISILMVAITVSLIKSLKRHSRLTSASGRRPRDSGASGRQGGGSSGRSKSSPQSKVTRMLFAVSLLFIVLNSPSHIIRTKLAIQDLLGQPVSMQPTVENQIRVVVDIIYYLSFGVNLLVYLCCGDNFRKVFVETYMSLCITKRRRGPCSEMTALSTVRLEEMDPKKDDNQALIPEQNGGATTLNAEQNGAKDCGIGADSDDNPNDVTTQDEEKANHVEGGGDS